MTRLFALLLLVLALLAGGCGSNGTDQGRPPERRVTVMLDYTPNTNHTGLYLARGPLKEKSGIDLDIVEPDQSGALAQLAAGNAQFAFSYAEEVLPARAQGTPVVSIATVTRTNTSSLVSPADRGIRRPRDLAGKTYGTYGGPIEKPLVKTLVACDGGDPDSVKFIDVGATDYSVGFRRKEYDVVWVFDGWDVIRLRDLQKIPITRIPFRDHFDCIPDWYTPVIVTTEKVITQDPELVRTFLAAVSDGYRKAIADPQAAADALMAAAPESDRKLVDASTRFLAPFYATQPGKWGHQDPKVWRRFGDFLVTHGIVKGPFDTNAAFTNAFLPPSAR
jgi:ABC-type nitrate/sulfonate/bicarbonate transport system substrate-binding protein